MAQWIEFHLLAAVLMVSVFSLPDLTWDTRTEDIVHLMNISEAEYIRHVRYETEDMPLECRTDLCKKTKTNNPWKGGITWPTISPGKRVYIRCPFALDQALYAHYDCLLNDSMNAAWADDVNMDSCPRLPLWDAIDNLNLLSISDNFTVTNSNMTDFLQDFQTIHQVIVRFSDAPLSPNKAEIPILLHLYELLLQDAEAISEELLQTIMDVADFLFEHTTNDKMAKLIKGFIAMTWLPSNYSFLGHQALTSFNERLIFVSITLEAGRIAIIPTLDELFVTAELPPDEETSHVINVLSFRPKGWATLSGRVDLPQKNRISTSFRFPLHVGVIHVSTISSLGSVNSNVILTQTLSHNDIDRVACAAAQQDGGNTGFDDSTWYTSHDDISCHLERTSINTSTCRCHLHAGFLAVAIEPIETVSYWGKKPPSNLDEFLGFPFRSELYVIGHVLRAISLLCLISTLVSYSLFRKTRRGRPSFILLHLCTSLTLLLILLYLAEVTAHTRTGCQVANVLRYYLVMVSLLWNAVEAYNMYLMLIKVFDQQTHRLVTKAALMAWGTPGVVTGIILAIDQKGFRGGYADCKFRCFLPEKTLFYCYLLPMSIIIIHNLVVFSLVLRVLVTSASAKNGSGHYWRQLSGALTMLVLLGVPWLFSAFGAVSHHASDAMKNTEAAFQIIFVLFVNMQGIFIFIFHCAGNEDIRNEWNSVFTGRRNPHKPPDVKRDTSKTASTSLSSSMTRMHGRKAVKVCI